MMPFEAEYCIRFVAIIPKSPSFETKTTGKVEKNRCNVGVLRVVQSQGSILRHSSGQ